METIAPSRLEHAEGRDHRRAGGGRHQERPQRERHGRAEERHRRVPAPTQRAVELERDDLPPAQRRDQLDADHRARQAHEPQPRVAAAGEQRADGGVLFRRHHHVDRPAQGREQPSPQFPVPQVRREGHAAPSPGQRVERRLLAAPRRNVSPEAGLLAVQREEVGEAHGEAREHPIDGGVQPGGVPPRVNARQVPPHRRALGGKSDHEQARQALGEPYPHRPRQPWRRGCRESVVARAVVRVGVPARARSVHPGGNRHPHNALRSTAGRARSRGGCTSTRQKSGEV